MARLQEAEAQWKQYQKRSVESLQKELEMHEQEAISLSKKIQDGAKEEFDWVEHVYWVECVVPLKLALVVGVVLMSDNELTIVCLVVT